MPPQSTVFLMYHELELPGRKLCQSDPGYVRYIISEFDFRSQMSCLQQLGWKGLSVGEALAFSEENCVAITFDDGCETDLICAAPSLKQAGFGATFYVTAGFLGKPGHMSAAQLRELSSLGFEIGCHSMTHAYLNNVDAKKLKTEIVESKQRLEEATGKAIEHFSCPGGRYDERTIQVSRDSGYRSVATSRVHANSVETDPFALGRLAILRGTSTDAFERMCRGKDLWRMQWRDRLGQAAKQILGNSVYDRARALLLK